MAESGKTAFVEIIETAITTVVNSDSFEDESKEADNVAAGSAGAAPNNDVDTAVGRPTEGDNNSDDINGDFGTLGASGTALVATIGATGALTNTGDFERHDRLWRLWRANGYRLW